MRAHARCAEWGGMKSVKSWGAVELMAIEKLKKDAPYAITGCMTGHFSIARHFGGITFQGYRYTYVAEHDELVRDDVLKLLLSLLRLEGRKKANEEKEAAAVAQGSLL